MKTVAYAWLSRLRQDEGGFVLPLVLVLFAIGLLVITPTLGHGETSLLANTATEQKAAELNAADSGVEDGLHWLTRDRSQDGPYQADNWATGPWVRSSPYVLNGVNVYVTIEAYQPEVEDNLYLITSLAEDPDGGSSTVLALVYAVPFVTIIDGPWEIDADYTGDVAVNGDLAVETGDTTITGTVTVDGSLTLGQGAEIIGDVYASGSIMLGQSSRIECEVLCTAGNLTLGQSTDIDPLSADVVTEVHFLNPGGSILTFDNTATLTGDVYAAGPLTILMQHKANTLTGNVYVEGDLTIDMTGSESQAKIIGPDSQLGLTNVYATGNVLIIMDSKFSKVDGDLYYLSGNTYTTSGSSSATWPTPHVCADPGACDWPESELECPQFPSNEAEIQIWEIA